MTTLSDIEDITMLEDLWPRTPADATADAMIRYYAAQGLHASTRSLKLVRNRTELGMALWTVNFEHLSGGFDRVGALRALQRAGQPDLADEIARDWWSAADAGDVYGEFLYEWAEAAGLDVQAICPDGPVTLSPPAPVREVPVVWSSEDGDAFWARGHVDPLLMVFGVFLEEIVCLGEDWTFSDFGSGLRLDDDSGALTPETAAAALTALAAEVRHYWAIPDPDNDERQIDADEGTEGAEPWTVLEL